MSRPIASVDVPASSANLGSGFDCFAAALSLKLRAELYPGDEAGITLNAHGEGMPRDDERGEENLLVRAFREGLRAGLGTGGGTSWRIEVSSMIPSARGLGSSAAAIVAGLLLGASVGRRSPEADELLAAAALLEGHADNAAAALYGGITLAVSNEAGVLLRRFHAPADWIPVVFLPQSESSTPEMRDALPSSVPHHEAAAAAGRAALLATAVISGDASLLHDAMDDRLHQPYRLPLLPGVAALIETAYAHGAAGAALSGAGPSVLAICDTPAAAHSVEKAFNAFDLPGMAMRLRFDETGARLTTAD